MPEAQESGELQINWPRITGFDDPATLRMKVILPIVRGEITKSVVHGPRSADRLRVTSVRPRRTLNPTSLSGKYFYRKGGWMRKRISALSFQAATAAPPSAEIGATYALL